MSRTTATIAVAVVIAATVAGCDDPNCFAGECPSGPTGVTSRYLSPEEEFFLDVGLSARGGSTEERIHRFEADSIRYHLGAELTDLDGQAVGRMLDEIQPLTGVTFILATDSGATARLTFELVPREQVVQATGDAETIGACNPLLAPDGSIEVGHVLIADVVIEESPERDRILRHEIGHCIGLLDHATDDYPESVIHLTGPDDLDALADVDVMAIQTLYDPRIRSGMARQEVLDALGW